MNLKRTKKQLNAINLIPKPNPSYEGEGLVKFVIEIVTSATHKKKHDVFNFFSHDINVSMYIPYHHIQNKVLQPVSI